MGFVKGTDGIARTVRNPLEGSIGDITLNDVGVATLTASANISTLGNLVAVGNVNSGNVVAVGNVNSGNVVAVGNVNSGNVVAVGNVDSGNVVAAGLVRGVTVQASGNVTAGNANISTSVNTLTVNTTTVNASNVTVSGNISGKTAGFALGYRDIPQVSFSGNATIATTDAGKHFYSTQSTSYILTIANNASQAFQTGSAMTIINQGTGNITVAQDSGVALYLAGNATSGNRTVSTFGMATLIKVATDTWFINGTGVA
jgi:hypothetical protein